MLINIEALKTLSMTRKSDSSFDLRSAHNNGSVCISPASDTSALVSLVPSFNVTRRMLLRPVESILSGLIEFLLRPSTASCPIGTTVDDLPADRQAEPLRSSQMLRRRTHIPSHQSVGRYFSDVSRIRVSSCQCLRMLEGYGLEHLGRARGLMRLS